MIIDCFPFFNELEILEMRLHEMDPWVDRFVLVESRETFSGDRKPLIFQKNKQLFKPYLHKITHLISPTADTEDAWERQSFQRNYVMGALKDCAPDDLIMVGDCDEILKGRDFGLIKRQKTLTTFIHKNFMFYLNLRRFGGWPGTVMLTYSDLVTKYKENLWEVRKYRRKGKMVKNGGWHFANMGGKEKVVLKLKSSCHYDNSSYQSMINNPDVLYNYMEEKRNIKGRYLQVVLVDETYPVWLKQNINKFAYLLTKEESNGREE